MNMTDETRRFLEKELPEALNEKDVGNALWMLFELINDKGFAPPHYDEYNDFGRKAQLVYDDLYLSNR